MNDVPRTDRRTSFTYPIGSISYKTTDIAGWLIRRSTGNRSSCAAKNLIFFAVAILLESAEKVHQVPGIIGLNDVGK
jgi:hypothetical protein